MQRHRGVPRAVGKLTGLSCRPEARHPPRAPQGPVRGQGGGVGPRCCVQAHIPLASRHCPGFLWPRLRTGPARRPAPGGGDSFPFSPVTILRQLGQAAASPGGLKARRFSARRGRRSPQRRLGAPGARLPRPPDSPPGGRLGPAKPRALPPALPYQLPGWLGARPATVTDGETEAGVG